VVDGSGAFGIDGGAGRSANSAERGLGVEGRRKSGAGGDTSGGLYTGAGGLFWSGEAHCGRPFGENLESLTRAE
jgi:hypothetical protein